MKRIYSCVCPARVALALSAVGLLLAGGCSSQTSPPVATASGTTAADSTAGVAVPQSPLTSADLNPAMSDAQKAAALQRKNR